jgi:hypothetical protein
MKSLMILVFVMCAVFQYAHASAPVRKTITGCVSGGVFRSDDGYVIELRRRSGGTIDVSRWQGRRLRVTGNLLPGDNLYLEGMPAILGRCEPR